MGAVKEREEIVSVTDSNTSKYLHLHLIPTEINDYFLIVTFLSFLEVKEVPSLPRIRAPLKNIILSLIYMTYLLKCRFKYFASKRQISGRVVDF